MRNVEPTGARDIAHSTVRIAPAGMPHTGSAGAGRRAFLRAGLAATAALATGCARQEGPWPSREVRVIVHAAPGGMSDTVARFTTRGLSERLGVPVLCENRVGAMGAVAFSAVKYAAPDGYLLGYAPVELAVVPHLKYVDLSTHDFDLLARHHRAPAALAVLASSPYRTLHDFVTAVRGGAHVAMGAAGPLSVWHLGTLALARQLGRDFTFAPFPGSGPATTALLGGHVDAVMAGVPEVQALVRGGAVRLLGIMAETPSPVFPEAATFRSEGLDLVFQAWGGFMTPKGVAASTRARLEQDVLASFEQPSFVQYCQTAGLDVQPLDSVAFRAFVDGEATRYASLLREFGFVHA
jgi:tripartite-type tricarboxylate transporter receptor subunit TctC